MEDKDILQKINDEAMSLEVPEELSQDNIRKKLPPIIYPEQVRKQRNKTYYKNVLKWTAAVVGPIAVAVVLMVICLRAVGIKYGDVGFYADHSILGTIKNENGFYTLKSYESLEKLVSRQDTAYNINYMLEWPFRFSFGTKDAIMLGVKGENNTGNFIDTEVRTFGVKEGDITVTDGEYIFCYGDSPEDSKFNYIQIIKPAEENTELINKIDLRKYIEDTFTFMEMYINDDMLIVMCYVRETVKSSDYDNREVYESATKVYSLFFDVSDVTNPKYLSTLKMDGEYESSRIKDGYLYVFSSDSYTAYDADIRPEVGGKIIPPENVYIGNVFSSRKASTVKITYKIIASVSLDDVTEFYSSIAVLSNDSQEYYVSSENIYMYFQISPWAVCTCNRSFYAPEDLGNAHIMKISYDKGKIEPAGTVTVDGEIDDTYCIDEYNGYLRLVVTVYDDLNNTSSSLYILDENLNKVGLIEDIAKGEVTSSALFLGDIAYFVTHIRRVDPLFSVDLSDPAKPEILGSLKLPGYTDYMRKWSDNLLLGFGYSSGSAEKLTLFDVSNPTDLKEVSTVEGVGDYEYLYISPENYKGKLISSEKNVIGFYTLKRNIYKNTSDVEDAKIPSYEVYSVGEDNSLQLLESIRIDSKGEYQEEYFYDIFADFVRGIYIDDYIYVVVPGRQVIVYDVLQDIIIADIDL